MQRILRRLSLLPIVLVLVHCGAGDSDSGGGAQAGATPFSGIWRLVATLNVNVAGSQTFITDTSEVVVQSNGTVVVRDTDGECTLNITVNGSVMTYQTSCIFSVVTEDASTSCTLTIVTRATIQGNPGSANLSGSFGPETVACRGVAAAYTGNLVGTQDLTDDTGDDDTDEDTT